MAIQVEVWGDYACFTRPEMKTERVSYDVMTPSAARGLLESIYWHPGLRWVIDRIHVCAPIRFTNIRRNEVKDVISARRAKTVMEKGQGELYLAASESIQQRAAMVLRDVHYVIDAHFDMTDAAAPGDNPGKFQDIIKRRLEKGQCYSMPYFGTREFPAQFRRCTELPPCPDELKGTRDLGWMLWDLDYSDPADITPKFFFPREPYRWCDDCSAAEQQGGERMILQALTRYYEDLLSRGEIAAPGWAPAKISLALYINENGELTQIVPTMVEGTKGKKTVMQPQLMVLPAAVKRTVSIASNFLWDNSAYLLGIDQKGKPERSRECFAAAAKLHHAVLDGIDSPNARAILAFFDTWEPERAAEHPALIRQLNDVTAGGNLVFRVDGRKVEEDAAIREAWQRYRDGGESGVKMQCLVTGKEDEIAAVHPSVKGVRDAQSSGAALVSFNAPAFCSYGREQNYNAPVGKYAAFAYTAALNHLLADSDHVQHIGDTTVVCWAEGADDAYPGFFSAVIGGGTYGGLSDNDLRAALKRLANGLPCDDLVIDPNRPFYILGLAPNAARLSVRFFLRDSFGALMKNINDHYERMEIVRPAYEKFNYLPLWSLLRETVNLNSRDKAPSPAMAGATARAIFSGARYPASLLEAVMLRIRAERDITWGKAAIIKAYYLKNPHEDCPKEVLTVSLNEASTNPAYTLGRLFSVYEAVQQAANPGINATIKDKYFNSAAAMPASIFPVLNNLCQKHLRKLDARQRVHYDKQIMKLKGVLNENYPARMTLAQQGSFDLGYYHQTQKRYTKKEEKENV